VSFHVITRNKRIKQSGCTTVGTDEKAIINVLAHRSCEQRQAIKLKFKSMYGKVRSPM